MREHEWEVNQTLDHLIKTGLGAGEDIGKGSPEDHKDDDRCKAGSEREENRVHDLLLGRNGNEERDVRKLTGRDVEKGKKGQEHQHTANNGKTDETPVKLAGISGDLDPVPFTFSACHVHSCPIVASDLSSDPFIAPFNVQIPVHENCTTLEPDDWNAG